jgi:hypothetical protein
MGIGERSHTTVVEKCLSSPTAQLPSAMNWTIAFDGRNIGQVRTTNPERFDFYRDVGQQKITGTESIPTIGKASQDFAGFLNGPVYRPSLRFRSRTSQILSSGSQPSYLPNLYRSCGNSSGRSFPRCRMVRTTRRTSRGRGSTKTTISKSAKRISRTSVGRLLGCD